MTSFESSFRKNWRQYFIATFQRPWNNINPDMSAATSAVVMPSPHLTTSAQEVYLICMSHEKTTFYPVRFKWWADTDSIGGRSRIFPVIQVYISPYGPNNEISFHCPLNTLPKKQQLHSALERFERSWEGLCWFVGGNFEITREEQHHPPRTAALSCKVERNKKPRLLWLTENKTDMGQSAIRSRYSK